MSLGGRTISRAWPLANDQRLVSFPLPAGAMMLNMSQSGGAAPWATVQVSAAVPLRQPLFAGYKATKTVSMVQARHPGQWTRGDVVKVTITVDASAERNWVVVSDPIPAGATIIGDLGGQSQILGQQERAGDGSDFTAEDGNGKLWDVQAGVEAAYVERGRDAWRGHFAWVPRGRFQVQYLMRLNGAGHFNLPPTRIEAMYSPAIRAQLPNQPVTIAQK